MSERKELGRIQRIAVGFGGYQDAMLGISFSLGGKNWGVSDFWGAWGCDWSDSAEWSEEQRCLSLGMAFMRLRDVLRDAQIGDVSDLQDAPIEATFDGMTLKSWRILTEVIGDRS